MIVPLMCAPDPVFVEFFVSNGVFLVLPKLSFWLFSSAGTLSYGISKTRKGRSSVLRQAPAEKGL